MLRGCNSCARQSPAARRRSARPHEMRRANANPPFHPSAPSLPTPAQATQHEGHPAPRPPGPGCPRRVSCAAGSGLPLPLPRPAAPHSASIEERRAAGCSYDTPGVCEHAAAPCSPLPTSSGTALGPDARWGDRGLAVHEKRHWVGVGASAAVRAACLRPSHPTLWPANKREHARWGPGWPPPGRGNPATRARAAARRRPPSPRPRCPFAAPQPRPATQPSGPAVGAASPEGRDGSARAPCPRPATHRRPPPPLCPFVAGLVAPTAAGTPC